MDLHERLTAAVNARLDVARAAGADWGPRWMITRVQPYTDPVVLGSTDGENLMVVGTVDVEVPEQIHIAANDPATVIRHCERDLRVLERHAPRQMTFGPEPRPSQCEACADMCHSGSGLGCDDLDAPYPCDEIRDMATAYAVGVLE